MTLEGSRWALSAGSVSKRLSVNCACIKLIVLHRFISDVSHFTSFAVDQFALGTPASSQETSEFNREPASCASGQESTSRCSTASCEAASVDGMLVDVLLRASLLVIPETSWSTTSFGIVVPEAHIIPSAPDSWLQQTVEQVLSECASNTPRLLMLARPGQAWKFLHPVSTCK